MGAKIILPLTSQSAKNMNDLKGKEDVKTFK